MATRQMLIGTVFPTAFEGQTVSIDFDGSTELMKGSSSTISITNTFTLAFWIKPGDVTTHGTLVAIKQGAGNNNFIRLHQRTDIIQTLLNDSAATVIQNVSWTSLLSDDTWFHVVYQWDGISGRKLYLDGVDQGAPDSAPIDDDGTLTDTARFASVSEDVESIGDPGPGWEGRGASWAIWDSILTSSEITAIYNAGSIAFNLAEDGGNYASSANLQHWWQMGRVSADIGKDSGKATSLIDLIDNAVAITTDDIVVDAPS